ncbi:MAG: excinuclease ABC subunit UvrA [Phycisphaerae bacterium]
MAAYSHSEIRVAGAREHNLRSVSLTLPKGKLICFTGVSGSGKSSMAFDTLYAEGQRRYIESLSSYARQFLGELPKPDVDQITGLAPSISIQQKTSGWNPRSTVGTITQIHDYLRVLMARGGDAHCPKCARPITAQTREHMIGAILSLPAGTRFMLLAPKVRAQKGEHKDLFAELVQQGFVRARVDGELVELDDPPPLDRYRRHDIEVVVDRLVVSDKLRSRLADTLDTALAAGNGTAIVALAKSDEATKRQSDEDEEKHGGTEARRHEGSEGQDEADDDDAAEAMARRADTQSKIQSRRAGTKSKIAASASGDILLSSGYACTTCGIGYEPPHPQLFSFNSPQGMCSTCDGLGTQIDFDPDLLIPDKSLNFLSPCIKAFRGAPGRWRKHIYEGVAKHLGIDLKTRWRDLPAKARHALLHGTGDEHITFEWRGRQGLWKHGGTWEGAIEELRTTYRKSNSTLVRSWFEQYMRAQTCPSCKGARLNAQALAITLSAKLPDESASRRLNLNEICQLPISRAMQFFSALELPGVKARIAEEPLKEIRARLRFLLDVGLDYLTLDRSAPTLSGGESQRIRLASQIGCGLVGVLYVLDEPSIGLHPRDNKRLLASLQRLRDMGNTVIVVEHDEETMRAADYIVDFGPGAGVRGGEIVAEGTMDDVRTATASVTGAFLSGRSAIEIPSSRRPVVRAAAERGRGVKGSRGQAKRGTGDRGIKGKTP